MSPAQISDIPKYFSSLTYDVKKVSLEFTKPIMSNVFFINMDALVRNSDFIVFENQKWVYRPTMFCKDVYEEPLMYPVVLLTNNIGSFLEFNPDNFYRRVILAPKKDIIIELLSQVTNI